MFKTGIVTLILGLAICGVCFDYCLDTYIGKDVHWAVDCSAGLVTSAVVVPGAVIGVVLVACDVETPIFKVGGDS